MCVAAGLVLPLLAHVAGRAVSIGDVVAEKPRRVTGLAAKLKLPSVLASMLARTDV
jgi:hypothetical protein